MTLTKVHFYVEMYQIMEHKKFYMRILKLDYGLMAYQVTQRASFFIKQECKRMLVITQPSISLN